MTGRLDGRVAIVTGAGQGIGRAFAHRFAQEGARVVIADVNAETAERTAGEIGETALAVRTDVTDPASARAAVDATVERFGRVDVLLNNASIFATLRMRPFWEIPLEEWDALLRVNLTGVFVCCQAVAGPMRAQADGRIINISSSTVLMGRANYAHYVASKAGVQGLTRALASELGPEGVTVNAIMPGSVETEVPRETVSPEQAKAIVGAQALRRRLRPEDIVGTAVHLASEDGAMITGQTIVVDGGLSYV
jgi:3-oxoacyl-[acyl-carrier protein] reductase